MRLFFAALALVLLADAASAQFRRSPPIAEQGDVAVVASLGSLDDLQLESLLGGIGVRYRLADQTVLGASVGFDVGSAESDASGTSVAQQSEQDRTDARLALWVEQHLGRRRRVVSPFVGAGLRLGRGGTEQTAERTYEVCPTVAECELREEGSEAETDALSVGAALLLGAEVKLVRGVTLGGAYLVGVEYVDSETTVTYTDSAGEVVTRTSGSETVQVGTGTTRVALSVYF